MAGRVAILLLTVFGLRFAFAAEAAQRPGLSKAGVDQALLVPEILAKVRIRLAWDDSESCEIAGDGSVFVWRRETGSSQPHLPPIMATLRKKLPAPTVAAIVRLFADERFLTKPIRPKQPNLWCYTLRLTIPGLVGFECKHPDLALSSEGKDSWWVQSQGPQDPTAQRIIYAIREAVAQVEEQVRVEDGQSLSREALLKLAEDASDNLWLELKTGGYWGTSFLRLAESGEVSGFSMRPQASGRPRAPMETRIPREQAKQLIETTIREGVLDHVQRKQTAIVDSSWWALTLEAKAEGKTYRRALWLWPDEAKETPSFSKVAEALFAIWSAWEKKQEAGKAR